MTRPIQLLVPMSGQGTRYVKAGYRQPKPLIPVNGTPMVERLLKTFPATWPAHFVLANNHRKTPLPKVLKKLRPKGRIYFVEEHALGPGRAIEAAIDQLPVDAPVFVSYCDYGQVWDARKFEAFVRKTDCDTCLVSYRGFHAHYLSPVTYAYSRLQGDKVVEVREKGSFTDNRENEFASAGGYYFKSASLLKKALEYQKSRDLRLNGEFYTSLTVQALIEMQPEANVRVYEIPAFFQWGTPEDLEKFEYWERTFQAVNKETAKSRGKVSQILMPMAGKGSRFDSFGQRPKPFIQIDGREMFRKALETLPSSSRTVMVTLASAKPLYSAKKGETVVWLDRTPEGQALSTDAGISALSPERDVIVSACDHGVAMGASWNNFIRHPRCDAAIFTVRGFPGTKRRPEAFAYVETKNSRETFPLVSGVSVKKPVSATPEKDALLVGTFWFKSARLLKEAIADIVRDNVRVNGELYLDSVFNSLIRRGMKVRSVPLAGYVNWGDPDALAEALYWRDVWSGRRKSAQPRYPGVRF